MQQPTSTTPPWRYRPGRTASLTARAPCLYPSCSKLVDYRPPSGGRAAQFCSTACRANFYNIQRQLEAHEARLLERQTGEESEAAVAKELDLVRWHLLRFRSLAAVSSGAPDPT